MLVNDPIADLLTRIRNGQHAGHDVISVPASKMKIAIAHILKEEGFIRAYKCIRDSKQGILKIALKYHEGTDNKGVIQGIHRISKPSLRRYVQAGSIPYVRSGYGMAILSTSQGVMACREARKRGVGGEYLCAVY